MGFRDKAERAKDQASELLSDAVDKHGDKVVEGVDRAAQALDDRTGGKHSDKIAGGAEKVQEALEKLEGTDAADAGDADTSLSPDQHADHADLGPDGTGR